CKIESCTSTWEPGSPLPWSLVYTSGLEGDAHHYHTVRGNTCKDSQAAHMTINTKKTIVENNFIEKTRDRTQVSGPGIRLGHAVGTHSAEGCVVRGNTIKGIKSDAP